MCREPLIAEAEAVPSFHQWFVILGRRSDWFRLGHMPPID